MKLGKKEILRKQIKATFLFKGALSVDYIWTAAITFVNRDSLA